jgi:type I restriction-modification system DNA methylase subunit
MRFDYILANPPFNVSDWGGERLREDARWKIWRTANRQRQLCLASAHSLASLPERYRRRGAGEWLYIFNTEW